jgi:hypothetical protein
VRLTSDPGIELGSVEEQAASRPAIVRDPPSLDECADSVFRRLKVTCGASDGQPLGRLSAKSVFEQSRYAFPDPVEELIGDLKRERCKHLLSRLLGDAAAHRSRVLHSAPVLFSGTGPVASLTTIQGFAFGDRPGGGGMVPNSSPDSRTAYTSLLRFLIPVAISLVVEYG